MKDHVSIRIESPAFEQDTVRVLQLSGTETVSRLFELQLRLVTTDPAGFDEEKLLTSLVALVFERTSNTGVVTEERRIVGTICTLRDRALVEAAHREVLVTFVPRMWQTTLTKTSDIFMDMTIPEIIQKKLQGNGLGGTDVELRLKGSYAPREFVVQYKESDHDFICRLAEDLGIHFFFEEKDGKDHLVFGDHNEAFKDASPQAAPFVGAGDRTSVYQLEATRQVVPKQFKARDYNYRNPSVDVLGEASNTTMAAGGYVDEFGPHAKTGEEATFYAKIRAEEAMSRHLTFEGESELPGLRAGSVLLVEGHPRGEMELAILEVHHRATQPALGQAAEGHVPYSNTFRAIPMNVAFRPPRITPKPVVHGVVTGVVESGAATNFGAVDEEGRYRVSFMYDTVSERGEGKASRPLRMAQPSAGADRGFHQPLKPGTEVVITCLNGDPDRPIIAGAVPNPQTPSPVTAANAEKSMWKTNVNQIAIDDDRPRMKMTVNGEDHGIQIGEDNFPDFGVFTATVGNASTMVDGATTLVSDTAAMFENIKSGFTTETVVGLAGFPNPWAVWKKWEARLNSAAQFTKAATSAIDAVNDKWIGVATDVREQKETAAAQQKAAEAAKQKAAAAVEAAKIAAINDPALGIKEVKNEPRLGADGISRPETSLQATDRVLGAAASANPEAQSIKALQRAKEEYASAAAAADEAAGTLADADDAVKSYEESPLREATKTVAAVADTTVNAVKRAKATLDGLGKAISALGGKAWVSKITKKLQSAAGEAIDVMVTGSQKTAAAAAASSGQRHKADTGTFDKPYNIQAATDSVALYGVKNAFVFGGKTATAFGVTGASLVSGRRVDVKSRVLAEVASGDVYVTARRTVDVHASEHVKIVAHTAAKSLAMPGGHSMYLHSRHSVLVDSIENDVVAKGRKNVKIEAQDEDVDVKAKKNVKLTAEQDFAVAATTGKGSITAKKTLDVVADDTMTLHGKAPVNILGKELKLDSSGDIVLKAKALKVNGKKIQLL